MSVSKEFKQVIEAHLTALAERDEQFAETFKKPAKNIEQCCAYILSEVKRLGQQGFADDEVYAIAIHYYDEDNITFKEVGDCKVVVNHHIDKPVVPARPTPIPTPSRPVAPVAKTKKPVIENQPSLF